MLPHCHYSRPRSPRVLWILLSLALVCASAPVHAYTLDVTALGLGTVAKAPDKESYDPGTTVVLTATAAECWSFMGWTGDASGTANPYALTMDEDKAITALFTIKKFTLNITLTGCGTVVKVPDRPIYDCGTVVQLIVVPCSGWNFHTWSGDVSGSTNPIQLVMNRNWTITAAIDVVTAVLVARFDAEAVDGAIEVRWELNGVEATSAQLERALDQQGPWTAASVEAHLEGSLMVARDRSVEPGREYWYRLAVTIPGAGTVRFGPIHTAGMAAVEEFELSSIAPNPSFGPATVRFAIAHEARVSIAVVDVQGRLVATLIDGPMATGRYQTAWDGRSASGPASAGVYFARMRAGRFTKVQRFVLTP